MNVSELKSWMESTEESSWLATVNREQVTNNQPALSPDSGRFILACTGLSSSAPLPESVIPFISSKMRGFFEGSTKVIDHPSEAASKAVSWPGSVPLLRN